MNKEEKIRVLKQGRKLENRLMTLEEYLERAWARVTRTTQIPYITGVRASPQTDVMAEYLAKREQLIEGITNLFRMQRRILQITLSLDDPDLQLVLQLYYLHGKTFKEVAEKMELSERHVMTLHRKALDLL